MKLHMHIFVPTSETLVNLKRIIKSLDGLHSIYIRDLHLCTKPDQ